MIALQIKEVKNFMSRLFQKPDFDFFFVREIEVQTACTYKINGHRNQGFYSEEELEELTDRACLRWEELKALVFQMIRGSRTPLSLLITFAAREETMGGLVRDSGAMVRTEDISGAYLNLKFQAGVLMLITGVGFRTFVAGKEIERSWDQWVKKFLNEKEILFDEL